MSAARWRLQLLGGFELIDTRPAPVRLPGSTAMLLLARLAMPPQRAWSREELVELLWPGVALDVGRNRLRQLLLVLRRQLEPGLLQADRLTVRLSPGALECDAERFEAALRGQPQEAARWYRGELMPGFYEEWVQDERRRLAALADRLAPATAPPVRGGLPRYLTRLLGAEAEVARLREAVCTHRLVTLVGPGGAGKTRLAVEVATALEAAGSPFQRVQFVPLAACAEPAAMLDALLVAFGLPGGRSLQALAEALAGRRLLVVLDNCEQLAERGAPLIAELAGTLPLAHWLLTSRRVLGLDGEREIALAPLPLPPARGGLEALARNPALALLLDRARAVAPDFRLDPGNADALQALLRALDGLPLAIELAATRLRSLPPQALLQRLQQHGGAALALERSGPRAGHDGRQASMLKVLSWSWSLLSAPARELLAEISVFEGPFDLAAAEALHGDDAALGLDELVQQSMLRADPATGRYLPYALIRDAAWQTLDEARRAELRQRHRDWLLRWAQALPPTPDLHEVRTQLPHIAAALVGAVADGADAQALRLFTTVQRGLADITLPPAARAALERALDRLPPAPTVAAARATLARAAMRAGDGAAAERLAEAALAGLPAQGLERAIVLARVAHIRWRLRRDDAVAGWLDEALAIAQAAGDLPLQASVLAMQGALVRPRDPEAAAALQRRAIAAWQAAGDGHGVNVGRHNLVIALTARPQTRSEALREAEQVCRDLQAIGDWATLAAAQDLRGEALSWLRRWDEAVAAYRQCIAVADEALEMLPLAYALWNLPGALAHRREPVAAGRLMGFAARFWAERFGALTATDRHDLRRVQRLVAVQVGAARAQALHAEGEAMALSDAVRLALGTSAQSVPSSSA